MERLDQEACGAALKDARVSRRGGGSSGGAMIVETKE
jgi:hypothetical protein